MNDNLKKNNDTGNNNKTDFKMGKINLKRFIIIAYHQFKHNKIKRIALGILTITIIIYSLIYDKISYKYNVFNSNRIIVFVNDIFNLKIAENILTLILPIVIYLAFVVSLSIPTGAKKKCEKLHQARTVNNAGETPIFVVEYTHSNNEDVTVQKYLPNGTDFEENWNKNKGKIDGAYDDLYLKGLRPLGKYIYLHLSKTNPLYPSNIYLTKDNVIKSDEFKIVTGKNQFDEDEVINLSINPHTKVIASTGGGKTYIQKSMAIQVLMLNHYLFVADLKRTDYKGKWKNLKHGIILNTKDGVHALLKKLAKLHIKRSRFLESLDDIEIDTIAKYNAKMRKKGGFSKGELQVVLVLEEITDILVEKEDIKNLSVEAKKRYDEIILYLTILSRKSRSTAISIFLNSQRLSANNVPPQIISNITNNLTGKSNGILSLVARGDELAHTMIPKDSKGLFIDHNNTLIQGYLINEDELLEPFTYKTKPVKTFTEKTEKEFIDNLGFFENLDEEISDEDLENYLNE